MAVLNVIRYPTGREMEIPPVIPIIFLPAKRLKGNYIVTVAN